MDKATHCNQRRRFVAGLAALPLVTSLPGVGRASGKPIPMRIGIAAQTSWLVYTARKMKFFEEVGLEPSFIKLTTGVQAIAAMASDNVDIASPGITPFVAGLAQGVEWQAIGFDTVLTNAEGFVARQGSGIETLEDLKGKTVGVARGSTSYYGLLAALETKGIGKDDFNMLVLGPAEQVGAMANGDLDAVAVWEPWIQRQIKDNGAHLIGMEADYGVHTGCAMHAVNTTFAQENSEAVNRFLNGLLIADEYLKKEGPETAHQAVADAMGLDKATVSIMFDEAPVPEIRRWADPDYQYSVVPGAPFSVQAQKMTDFMFEERLINTRVDVSNALDSDPISRVLEARDR